MSLRECVKHLPWSLIFEYWCMLSLTVLIAYPQNFCFRLSLICEKWKVVKTKRGKYELQTHFGNMYMSLVVGPGCWPLHTSTWLLYRPRSKHSDNYTRSLYIRYLLVVIRISPVFLKRLNTSKSTFHLVLLECRNALSHRTWTCFRERHHVCWTRGRTTCKTSVSGSLHSCSACRRAKAGTKSSTRKFALAWPPRRRKSSTDVKSS